MFRRSLSAAEKKRIAAAGEWSCAMCKSLLPASFQIDHVIPLADGGADDASNMHALCANCHADKTQCEAIRRGKSRRVRQRVLFCSRCESKVSPYFLHSCDG